MTTISQLRAAQDANPFAAGALASGAYLLSNAIDNRETVGSVAAYTEGDLQLIVSSTTPSAGDYLTVAVLEATDGGTTNYASPNGASASPPSLIRGTYWCVAAATTVITIRGILLGPYSLKLLLCNRTSNALTISSSTFQRRTTASW